MRVAAFHSAKERDAKVVGAFAAGVRALGEEAEVRQEDYPGAPDADVALVFGVKGRSKFDAYRRAGLQVVYLDKGYLRAPHHEKYTKHWRLAVNAHHPTRYLRALASPHDRWEDLDVQFAPWRRPTAGGHIVLAGSSAKAHRFNSIQDPTAVAQRLVRQMRALTARPIVYRPKPTWKDARPVLGAQFEQGGSIVASLQGAHALVTVMSNSCWEAVLAGVPCVVLGEAVAAPISSTKIRAIEEPYLAPDEERRQWFADLAYCQYSTEEMRAGLAWRHVRRVLELAQ